MCEIKGFERYPAIVVASESSVEMNGYLMRWKTDKDEAEPPKKRARTEGKFCFLFLEKRKEASLL